MAIVPVEGLHEPIDGTPYVRTGTVPVEVVVAALKANEELYLPNGTALGILNARMGTYAYQQHCAYTGVPVAYFAIERCRSQPIDPSKVNEAHQFHLNAYAVIEGVEVMVNSDHIIPKSLSGVDGALNRQPLLQWANTKKGHTVFEEDLLLADARGVWQHVADDKGQILRDTLSTTAIKLNDAYSLPALKRQYIEYKEGDWVRPRKGQFELPNHQRHNSGVIEAVKGENFHELEVLVYGQWFKASQLRKSKPA